MKILSFPQYDYIVAVCPRMKFQGKLQAEVEKEFCHNDCELHNLVFSLEVKQKFIVHLLCIPNESQEIIEKAVDIMERMYVSKSQSQLNEMLGIDKDGLSKEASQSYELVVKDPSEPIHMNIFKKKPYWIRKRRQKRKYMKKAYRR